HCAVKLKYTLGAVIYFGGNHFSARVVLGDYTWAYDGRVSNGRFFAPQTISATNFESLESRAAHIYIYYFTPLHSPRYRSSLSLGVNSNGYFADRESSTTPSTGGGVVDDGSGSADFDDPFDAINQLVDARLQVYSPLGLSIVHFRDLATPLSPADEVLHVVREVAAKGRNSGLWVTKANGEVATSSFVARIDDTGNKVGPIGDLDPYQNRVDPRDLRRVKARISLCSLDIPYGAFMGRHNALISEAKQRKQKIRANEWRNFSFNWTWIVYPKYQEGTGPPGKVVACMKNTTDWS
ncbi:hypothetical protein BT96DRAFT_935181, partial [Gymnopus androsaceus JB14]